MIPTQARLCLASLFFLVPAAFGSQPPQELEPSLPEITCENYVDELERLKAMELENMHAFAAYMDDTVRLLEHLYLRFRRIEDSNKALPAGSAKDLRDRADQIMDVQGVAYANGDILDNRFAAIIKRVKTCGKKD